MNLYWEEIWKKNLINMEIDHSILTFKSDYRKYGSKYFTFFTSENSIQHNSIFIFSCIQHFNLVSNIDLKVFTHIHTYT